MAEDPPDPPNERLSSYMPGLGERLRFSLRKSNPRQSPLRACALAHNRGRKLAAPAARTRKPRVHAQELRVPHTPPDDGARHSPLTTTLAAPADQKPMSLMDQLNAMSSTAAKAADDVAAEGAKTDAKMGRVRRKSKDLEDTINAVAAAAAVPEPETAKPEHLKRMDDY